MCAASCDQGKTIIWEFTTQDLSRDHWLGDPCKDLRNLES
jgi:hypothetical protein